MIDTARHWLPVGAIKRQIEAAASTKMNTVHWHAVDADGFPLELETFPALASRGSYSLGPYRMTYTVAEQQEIVEFARQRGVRIVLEMDLPGHSAVWAYGAPPGAFLFCDESNTSAVLDVTSPAAYAFVDALLTEIAGRFPERVLQLGGDEVGTTCWNRSASVRAWLAAHPAVSLEELYPRHMLAAYQMAGRHNRTAMAWNPGLNAARNYSANATEPGRGAMPAGAGVQLWSQWDFTSYVEQGQRVVVSVGYYFNAAPTISNHELTWEDEYRRDPACRNASDRASCLWLVPVEHRHNFLGAEACQWGEATDNFNVDEKTWFRLPAVAERLWTTNASLQARGYSPAEANYWTKDVVARLVKHRCRLLQRGIRAQAYAAEFSARSKWAQCQGWLPPAARSSR